MPHAVRRPLLVLLAAVTAATTFLVGVPPAEAQSPADEFPFARPRTTTPQDRWHMAGGCYTVDALNASASLRRDGGAYTATGDSTDAEPFHFQATDLGIYLLYGTAEDFMGVAGTPLNRSVSIAGSPSTSTEWVIDGDGPFTLSPLDTGESLVADPDGTLRLVASDAAEVATAGQFGFTLTTGCAAYPEVEINISGQHPTGPFPTAETRGYAEAHMHGMAYEFLGGGAHCGKPWDRYGVAFALVDCPDHEGNGFGAVLEAATSGDQDGHDPVGWPTFVDWPAPRSLTHEQSYHRWTERAWRGGLRLYVNLFVENRVLCELYPVKKNDCNEMNSVRLQMQRIEEMQDYIDAQYGGPGRGWFRLVDDPFEARKVINEGRLAVVRGIEVSELFNCRSFADQPLCTQADIDAMLQEVWDAGVRQMELLNKFDTALAGVAGDSGSTGMLTNQGNFASSGSYLDMETCPDSHGEGVHDNEQATFPGPASERDALFGGISQVFGQGPFTPPLYPSPPHCNTVGLLPLGSYVIEKMAEMGMIFDPDHMSVKARKQALDLTEALDYPGVASSHTWSTPDAYPRIQAAGGFIAPYAGGSEGFVNKWQRHRDERDPRYLFGIGWGADANGLGSQGSPRGADVPNPVTYPFTGFGGVTIDQQVSGERVYDINVDGVAHYGLYPDWVEDLRMIAGDQIVEDLELGAEAYLHTWERAMGVPEDGCRSDVTAVDAAAVDTLQDGDSIETVLMTLGQPVSRTNNVYEFCVGADKQRVTVTFASDCTAADVRSAAAAAPQPPPPPLPATGGGAAAIAIGLLAAAGVLGRRRD